jgi:hypothetical protein
MAPLTSETQREKLLNNSLHKPSIRVKQDETEQYECSNDLEWSRAVMFVFIKN